MTNKRNAGFERGKNEMLEKNKEKLTLDENADTTATG